MWDMGKFGVSWFKTKSWGDRCGFNWGAYYARYPKMLAQVIASNPFQLYPMVAHDAYTQGYTVSAWNALRLPSGMVFVEGRR